MRTLVGCGAAGFETEDCGGGCEEKVPPKGPGESLKDRKVVKVSRKIVVGPHKEKR